MSTIDNITAQINENITNYAPKAFQNNSLRTILLEMLGILPGGGNISGGTVRLSGANFINATDCPVPLFAGFHLRVEMKGIGDLVEGTGYQALFPNGFTILIPGFDATAGNLTDVFYVSILIN